jgi:starch-binding outer membrane protein, SusD/RagB family
MRVLNHRDALSRPIGRGMSRRALSLVVAALLTAGCGDLLDVENPNNIAEESLDNPAAATQQANGVEASLARMLSAVSTPYAVATDELDWIGSRDAWDDQETGAISNYLNEFTDQAFPFVGEVRYLGDQTIARLEAFHEAGTLLDETALIRSYFYTAIAYATIADMFDDFAFSNKTEAGPPVGRDNMGTLYDTALDYLTKALALSPTGDLQYGIQAYIARVKHGQAVWQLLTPKGSVPANPLVNAGVADAQAALALSGTPDKRFQLFANIEVQPAINVFFEVNGRNEHRVGTVFRTLVDPITGSRDPVSARLISEFEDPETAVDEGYITIVSNRELRLIIAEAALATGNSGEFATQINAIRALDNLPPWTGQIPALEILKFERQANLWLQMRRLNDLYRFGIKPAEWRSNPNFESAFSVPGLLFPVPNIERLANPCFASPSACGG